LSKANDMRIRRSFLIMPGDNRRMIEKAAKSNADCIVMDLEDGVAFSKKDIARKQVKEALMSIDFGKTEKMVRINPIDGDLGKIDLREIIQGNPDCLILPKVEDKNQVTELDKSIEEYEHSFSFEPRSIKIIATIESSKGITNVKEIASASKRLVGLAFGAEDLAGDMNADRRGAGKLLTFNAKCIISFAASAVKIDCIDTPFLDYRDTEGLKAEAVEAYQIGFTGKFAIHPCQLSIINDIFVPSQEQINWAKELIAAYEDTLTKGDAIFVFDGKMVDQPTIIRARKILDRATQAGML